MSYEDRTGQAWAILNILTMCDGHSNYCIRALVAADIAREKARKKTT